MKNGLTILFTFIALISFSQVTEDVLYNQGGGYGQQKKIGKHPKLVIRIDSLQIGENKYDIDFNFKGKINTQTGLLEINDTIALNVLFLQIKILDKKEYFYSYNFYQKRNKNQKWTEVSTIQFYNLIPGSYTDGWGGIGYQGDANCFWYKMYCEFK